MVVSLPMMKFNGLWCTNYKTCSVFQKGKRRKLKENENAWWFLLILWRRLFVWCDCPGEGTAKVRKTVCGD